MVGPAVVILVAGYVTTRQRVPDAAVPSSYTSGATTAEIGSAVDAAFDGGRWYVGDFKNSQIVVVDSEGQVRSVIGQPGRGPGELTRLRSIAAAAGRVYVAEFGLPNIAVFDSAGRYHGQVSGEGRCGLINGLAASHDALFVVRRCLNFDRSTVVAVDRRVDDRLVAWGGADTVRSADGKAMAMSVPLIAADSQFVVFGDGASGCFTRFRVLDGSPAGRRCLTEVAPPAVDDSVVKQLSARFRGRLAVPTVLPYALDVSLVGGLLWALVPDDGFRATWKAFDWAAEQGVRLVGAQCETHAKCWFSDGGQLTLTENEDGIVIQVSHPHRP